ncbi:hypothetical protein BDR07DRAFT_1608445 [Suillus spraguei]|nr:hypothetical protein BDR07DRAFT_1608445 [Suillus spraguei]
MAAIPIHDIDKSNIVALRDDIPKVRGGRDEYALLNKTLDAILDIKTVATQQQVCVPALSKLLELYSETIAQGRKLRQLSWWKRIRKMRDWHGSIDEFKGNCETLWSLAHQTSFFVHNHHVDKSKVISGGPIRQRRSLDGLFQAEPDLVQRHNQHGDTPIRSTPPNIGVVAQSSSKNNINTNILQEETVQRIAEMSAAKTLEQFILHGRLRLFGAAPQTINHNHFNGCIVRPGGRATHTVNFGGSNNRGAAVNVCSSRTEIEENGSNDIDDTSDDDLLHNTAINATQSVSERHSSSAIPLEAQNNNTLIHPAINPRPSLREANRNGLNVVEDDGEDPHH